MGDEPTVYVSVQGRAGQLVVSGPLDLLREFLESVRERREPQSDVVTPTVPPAAETTAASV